MSEIMHHSWSEKYRPNSLDDCVLTPTTRKFCESFIEDNQIPNLLLSSKAAGVGKTTLAKVLGNVLNYDVLEINGSSDRNIDTLKNEITAHAETFSIESDRKIVLIDEADYLNPQSTQPALRNFIQEYSSNCSFIFTCNYVDKILKPLQSRFIHIDFDHDGKDSNQLKSGMMKRALEILDLEGVKYDKPVIAQYVNLFYPDFRSVINELQRVSKLGDITRVIDSKADEERNLVEIIKSKKFNKTREWAASNHSLGMAYVTQVIYKNVDKLFQAESKALAIQLAYDYCDKETRAANAEICIVACLTEIYLSC